jgi:hypothetical protein
MDHDRYFTILGRSHRRIDSLAGEAMPLTLTITEGVLAEGQEKAAFHRLAEAMLRWHGLSGNAFMTAAVIGSIHVVPRGLTYAGLHEASVAFIEWKVPPVAFTNREIQLGYVEEATSIIHELSGGRHPKDQIWVNVVHAVDGTWGIAGKAMTAVQLGAAIAAG